MRHHALARLDAAVDLVDGRVSLEPPVAYAGLPVVKKRLHSLHQRGLVVLDRDEVRRGFVEPVLAQQQVQARREYLHRRSRRAQLHRSAGRRVEHPHRHNNDDARRCLDVDDLASGTLLAVLTPRPLTIQGMPVVEDLDFLRDMRRMAQ